MQARLEQARLVIARGAAGGAAAGLAAIATMYVASALTGTRTLPALLSEPLLAALPGAAFGFLIDRLQHLGKVIEEGGLLLAMLVGLSMLGAATALVQARRPIPRLPLAAAGLGWLAIGLAALPLGGAGLLGLHDGLATPAVWAVVFAVYAVVLEMAIPSTPPGPVDAGRRRLLGAAPAAIGLLSLGVVGFRLVPGWLSAAGRPRAAGGAIPEPITPTASFYVVSKNFSDPVLDGGRWSLSVHGLASAPYRLSHAELRALPATTVLTTLECVSNNVGGDQISTGEFAGPRLAGLVQRAQPQAQARFANFRAADGYTESLPIDLVLSDPDILVAHSLGGVDLPAAHGFPARVLIPGRYGMKGPKWLVEIELSAAESGGYWEGQGWDRNAVVKTMSRIDTPVEGAILGGGTAVTVGGIAYAGSRGVGRVEVSTDYGHSWAPAELRPPGGPLTWVIWTLGWTPTPGEHTLVVRATDGQGTRQSPDESASFPSGSSGYHSVHVSVGR